MYQQVNPNEMPGVGASVVNLNRAVWLGRAGVQYLPGGGRIDGVNARDPSNTGALWEAGGAALPPFATQTPGGAAISYANTLQAGLLMGIITTSKLYGASIFGLTTAALGGGQTTLSVPPAAAVEIARRSGNSGTLSVTGPSVAGGTARTLTLSYSAVNTTTGAVTITADAAAAVSAVNAVEALPFVDSTGSGTFTLTIEGITTGPITYSATAATLYGNINTALNATFGTSAIVASGSTLAGIILTFSGTGYSGRPIASSNNGTVTAKVIATLLSGATGFTAGNNPTSSGVGAAKAGGSTTSTAGVTAVAADEGEFVAGSLVGPADGSQVPVTFIDELDGVRVTDIYGNGLQVQFPRVPIAGGTVNVASLINYSGADSAVKSWIKTQLNTNGKFTFSDGYVN